MSAHPSTFEGMVYCPACRGLSKVKVPITLRRGDGEADVYETTDCPPCQGRGFVARQRVCQRCGKFKSCCACARKG